MLCSGISFILLVIAFVATPTTCFRRYGNEGGLRGSGQRAFLLRDEEKIGQQPAPPEPPLVPPSHDLKDGYGLSLCARDMLLENGDKYGENKHSYTIGESSNVSIVRYNDRVARLDRKAMTPQVCFNFCRGMAGMLFFGIAHGRDCYCAPFFKEMPGDSSMCDSVCDGDNTQMCGGKSKSTLYAMHGCDDASTNLKRSMERAVDAFQWLGNCVSMADQVSTQMQSQAADIQKAFGALGDTVASDVMQTAKVSAGELASLCQNDRQLVASASAKYTEAKTILDRFQSDTTDADLVKEAEASTMSLLTLSESMRSGLSNLQKAVHRFSPSTVGNKFMPTATQPDGGVDLQYYSLMYFVDRAFVGVPTTCAGDMVKDPIVGKSYEECASECDEAVESCVGFSYFPSKLCFLFSKFKSVTYYTGCAGKHGSAAGQVSCAAKLSKFVGTSLKPDQSGKCERCLKTSKAVNQCPEYTTNGLTFAPEETKVSASVFAHGTYIISEPGVYKLTEDVVFDPKTTLTSTMETDSSFPPPTSIFYPQEQGYFLGFFAAVAIQGRDIIFDCQGHSMSMSKAFHKRQRFFSIFELDSKPFISGAGPPQFGSSLTAPTPVLHARNVTIQNCELGLSSHHGVHGNQNDGVVLKNLKMKDFEVGGIHLNGASNVVIENVDIGPSLKKTFGAQLSQAIFLDHLMNTLLMSNPTLRTRAMSVPVTLRGKKTDVSEVFSELHRQLQQYLDTNGGPLQSLFGSGDVLPDGSAMYGIVLHKKGPAVGDFGACPFFKAVDQGLMESNITMSNVKIHDLELNADQWTRLVLGGNQVMGPAGDVFRFIQVKNNEGQYVGHALSDAQIAVGVLKKVLSGEGLEPDMVFWYFGGSNMPDEVVEWAASGAFPWTEGVGELQCWGDAMSHHNKGVVGLRLAYLKDATMFDVEISSLKNTGSTTDPGTCVEEGYKGKDVYGVVVTNSPAVKTVGISVDEASLTSVNGGRTVAIEVKRT